MKILSKMKAGFSLVEVAMALGIASFCMVTLLALMPVGIQNYHKADAQSAMANLAAMVVRDLQSAPSGATSKTSQFQFQFPAAGSTSQTVYVDESGQASGTPPPSSGPIAASRYRITVTIYPPAVTTPPSVTSTTATILITSPALADPVPGNPPTKYTDRFETTVSLNRN